MIIMMIDDILDERKQNSQRNSTKHLLTELLRQTHEMAGRKDKYFSKKGHKIHRMGPVNSVTKLLLIWLSC